MIQIITKGPENFKVTCQRCLCEFTYELSDLVKYISYEYITCPQCKHEILHTPQNVSNYCDAEQKCLGGNDDEMQ